MRKESKFFTVHLCPVEVVIVILSLVYQKVDLEGDLRLGCAHVGELGDRKLYKHPITF